MALVSLTPHLTPHGWLLLVQDDDASLLEAELAHRIQNAFGRGAGHGLLHLGANEVGVALPPALSFWREFAGLYVSGVCMRPGTAAEAQSVHIPAIFLSCSDWTSPRTAHPPPSCPPVVPTGSTPQRKH